MVQKKAARARVELLLQPEELQPLHSNYDDDARETSGDYSHKEPQRLKEKEEEVLIFYVIPMTNDFQENHSL